MEGRNMSEDHKDSGWRKRQIALDIKAENARELGLDYEVHSCKGTSMRRIDYFWPRTAIQVTGCVFLFQLLNTAIGNGKQELDWVMPLSGVFFLSSVAWALGVAVINALNLQMAFEKGDKHENEGDKHD